MKPLKSDKQMFSARTLTLLSANPQSFGSSVMASAAAELKARQDKEDAEKAIAFLMKVDKVLKHEVASLKNIRNLEDIQRKRVKAVDTALVDFAADGDASKFIAAVQKVGIYV